ncbi:preprotein translocase subunit TatA [Halomicrobium salinisoli]|uniref:preprotein translocase subunit TatA n=1 Tax=Halomicrobium salinisoli TaxID=2878391 RepID=UPI001CF0C80E|nr:preprotein translocase subunit TatA [Halomicrobium salinisoli]
MQIGLPGTQEMIILLFVLLFWVGVIAVGVLVALRLKSRFSDSDDQSERIEQLEDEVEELREERDARESRSDR